MQTLPLPETVILFVAILSILVLAHEFGHFVIAKQFGIEVPEFGLGFPPRLLTLWRTPGWIQVQGKEIQIPKNLQLPRALRTGDYIRYSSREEKGRQVLVQLQIVDPGEASATLASQVQKLDRGTMYTVNALPLGGFVRLSGENDPTAPNGFAAKHAWKRSLVLVAGVTMNFGLAALGFFVLQAAFPQPIIGTTTQVGGFTAGSPAIQAGVVRGDTILSIDGVDVKDNYEAMLSQVQLHCGRSVSLGVHRVDARGVGQDLALNVTPQTNGNSQCALGVYLVQALGERISAVGQDSSGMQLGLLPGDGLVRVGDFQLVSLNGSPAVQMRSADELAMFVQGNSKVQTTVTVEVIRKRVLLPPLRMTIPKGIGLQESTLGLTLSPYLGLDDASARALKQMGDAFSMVPRSLSGIASGVARGQDTGVGGPIRVAQAVAEGTPSGGMPFIIYLSAIISLNLAILNLLPFPGLDGGRLAFVVLEVLRGGSRLNPRVEGIAHLIGMALLIVFMVFVSYNDVIRLLAGKSAFAP